MADLVGLDVQKSLKTFIPIFFTYEIPPSFYSFEELSEAFCSLGDHEGTLQFEYDDDSMETKIILTFFGGTLGVLRFDEKSIFKTFLGFDPFWDSKPPLRYSSEKIAYLSTVDKIH